MNLTVTVDGRTYEVTVEDINARPVVALVAGERFEVWPEEAHAAQPGVAQAPAVTPFASAAQAPARPADAESPGNGENTIAAPIPGVIVAVHVARGDKVEAGQEIFTLEAMKMKNSIRATHAGTVMALRAVVGDHVRHGQVLAELGE